MRLAAIGSFRVEWRAILLLSNVVGINFITSQFQVRRSWQFERLHWMNGNGNRGTGFGRSSREFKLHY